MIDGFTAASSAYPRPNLSMVPGLKFSATTSKFGTMRRNSARPSGDFRSMAMLCLPAPICFAWMPKMKAAEQGPVYQILAKFTDIHKDTATREKFEIFRHVVFDFNGDYYVAVPLDAPYRMRSRHGEAAVGREYTKEVANLQLEAHLLANLFSSFEKERIFSRVYSPFLTTRAIQRKLWRQGSKFAGSEAFRNACYAVACGAYDTVMAVGVEKLKDSGFSGLTGSRPPADGTEPSITAIINTLWRNSAASL